MIIKIPIRMPCLPYRAYDPQTLRPRKRILFQSQYENPIPLSAESTEDVIPWSGWSLPWLMNRAPPGLV